MPIIRGTDAEYLPTPDINKLSKKDFITDLEYSRNIWKTIQFHLEERNVSEEEFFEKVKMSGREQIMLKSNIKPTLTITKHIAEYFGINDYFGLYKLIGRLLEA